MLYVIPWPYLSWAVGAITFIWQTRKRRSERQCDSRSRSEVAGQAGIPTSTPLPGVRNAFQCSQLFFTYFFLSFVLTPLGFCLLPTSVLWNRFPYIAEQDFILQNSCPFTGTWSPPFPIHTTLDAYVLSYSHTQNLSNRLSSKQHPPTNHHKTWTLFKTSKGLILRKPFYLSGTQFVHL